MQDIREEIVRNLNSWCTCNGVTTNLITDENLLCLDANRAAVSFSAKLHGSSRLSVEYLRVGLVEWFNDTTSSIAVRSIEYDVDAFCTVVQDSRSDVDKQDCDYPLATIPTMATVAKVTTAVEGTSRTTTTGAAEAVPFVLIIVGGAAGVLVVLILAVVCGVVICVIVYARTKRPSESLR